MNDKPKDGMFGTGNPDRTGGTNAGGTNIEPSKNPAVSNSSARNIPASEPAKTAPVSRAPVTNPQLHNLTEEAAKRNAELAKANPKTVVKTDDVGQLDKLNRIKDVLRNSGADSNSQAKAFHQIVEILGW